MSETALPQLHARFEARRREGPPRVADQLPREGPLGRFNAALAVKITKGVGTMWCAYAFAALAIVSLPSAIRSGDPVVLVSWISQTFLQLVLLSIIIVGQNVLAAAADKRAEATYEDADAVLHTALQIERHLEEQDRMIESILARLSSPR
jgi:hypothetical protein